MCFQTAFNETTATSTIITKYYPIAYTTIPAVILNYGLYSDGGTIVARYPYEVYYNFFKYNCFKNAKVSWISIGY